ncbi:MAG: hypothetical protein KC897_06495 [Candidatus Omnitrophica bacterium]|nr:hypothetical protein [Candidatus Omnitrophota bacterium]MCA9403411.1 hypothetical protein [Candidatus Omnitrophota bacterium]
MSDLLWMNMQLSDRCVSRMLEEETQTQEDNKTLFEMLAETYLAPFQHKSAPGRGKAAKRIFGDTPGSFGGRDRSQW